MIANLLRSTFAFAIAASATALVVAGSAAPAAAATARTATVATRGIDFASVHGTARINDEVRRAARRVCATSDRSLAATLARHDCIDAALASAQPQIASLAAAAIEARTSLAEAAPTSVAR
ncbi:UrcA family protein [Polymorphobacter fuscus]|uniref:UrcA family protein n=1 Tax=Sandarakinorhabdus fusca TaxID=1439888 RepID=A0A7C9GZ51_9SPHN|nr:UrcA family protein [Polymorphobacter fuscus]KAB7644432.1 UrcA family protein [Polymorphobacter fuscus]MQT18354.1 UrcA family protein [Polymorphobacter fuscus]NJC08254.1 UrcA family protein [Polymorphobacter fuscus]